VNTSHKHDLIDALSAAGIDFTTQFAGMADKLETGVQRMLERAQSSGAVRQGVTAHEVMGLIIGASQSADHIGAGRDSQIRMVDIVCDGLREPHSSEGVDERSRKSDR